MLKWIVLFAGLLTLTACLTTGGSSGSVSHQKQFTNSGEDRFNCMLGWDTVENGDYQKGISLISNCIAEGNLNKSSLAEAYQNRGVAYDRMGKSEQAILDYSKAIELKPIKIWEHYVNRGNAKSDLKQYKLALKDYETALQLKPQNSEAIYYRGLTFERMGNSAKAKKDFSKAYSLGFRSDGLAERINYYNNNKQVSYDQYAPAVKKNLEDCLNGDNEKCTQQAFNFQSGDGVEKSFLHAEDLYKIACNRYDALACYNLGTVYYAYDESRQIPDANKSMKPYRKACDLDYLQACANLAYHYKIGKFTQRDISKAFDLYSKACNAEYTPSCSDLGLLYYKGDGIEKNWEKAVELFTIACKGGNANGCLNLADKHEYGEGTEKNEFLALGFFRLACNMGKAQGCSQAARLMSKFKSN